MHHACGKLVQEAVLFVFAQKDRSHSSNGVFSSLAPMGLSEQSLHMTKANIDEELRGRCHTSLLIRVVIWVAGVCIAIIATPVSSQRPAHGRARPKPFLRKARSNGNGLCERGSNSPRGATAASPSAPQLPLPSPPFLLLTWRPAARMKTKLSKTQ